jgi:hypothetical protein
MARRKYATAKENPFTMVPYMEAGGFAVHAGDIVKIKGEYGTQFLFRGVTTNPVTGATWADCFEIFRGKPQQFRAFRLDRVKRIPQKGKRARRVDIVS